jgi:YhcH/YjgK/YiaL family protein
MAIIGSTEILEKQTQNNRIHKALDYLKNADIHQEFTAVSPGNNKTVEIEGKSIFAIYQAYDSKSLDTIKLEGHLKYIDIQYIFEGEEQILLASKADIVKDDTYNEEKDFYFPEVKKYASIQLKSEDAAILFPEDLHGPGYCIEKPASVKKIVIKVKVD